MGGVGGWFTPNLKEKLFFRASSKKQYVFAGQNIEQTLCNIRARSCKQKQNLFPTVYRSYSHFLKVPVSVAKDERTFSKLKIIKNSLRSKMKDKRLNGLRLLAYKKDLTDTISLQDVLKNRMGNKCEDCRFDKLKILIFAKIKLSR